MGLSFLRDEISAYIARLRLALAIHGNNLSVIYRAFCAAESSIFFGDYYFDKDRRAW
jgi:hypothetical protein